jgi:hypothetical protein
LSRSHLGGAAGYIGAIFVWLQTRQVLIHGVAANGAVLAQTAMMIGAVCGSVGVAGGDFSHAPPLHSDNWRNVPHPYRLDTRFTVVPFFSRLDSDPVTLAQ